MSNPVNFTLEGDVSGMLTFIGADRTRIEKARPVRLFPFTDPAAWISIVNPAGRELALVEHLEDLPDAQQKVLRGALSGREFVPVIRSIDKVGRAATGYSWHVTTDRGATSFQIESDESIQQLGDSRLVVIDQRNTRYLIPDINALDRKSRQRLERYY
jgi:hypothetical protein